MQQKVEGGEDLAVFRRDGKRLQRQLHPGLAPHDQCIKVPGQAGFQIEDLDQAKVRPIQTQPQLSRDESRILGVKPQNAAVGQWRVAIHQEMTPQGRDAPA